MCSKIQTKTLVNKLSSSSPDSIPQDLHLSQGLLDPSQSSLTDILHKVPDAEIRNIITAFFRISSEACKIFETILKSIHQTRATYTAMGKVLEQLKEMPDDEDDDQRDNLYGSLTSFALLENPLAVIGQLHFQDIHDKLHRSLKQFTSRGKYIRRRRILVRRCKKIAGITLVAVGFALSIALTILTIHSSVGIVALPGLVSSSLGLFLKSLKKRKRGLTRIKTLETFETQIDNAAKGIFLLMNDFDTMSRLMIRLHDEIEHSKFIADLYLKRKSNEMLEEVLKDFRINKNEVINQLEEVEDHVYLCILNINRSRRLLTQEADVH
ncbi:OLC1v1034820C1 [Oldenlandia corymbosa var. corymbosa]|uniref:OLC1v1034820C1 n=1 Tax=Oldenlandia corymbosa var. corymbosa TaxID=529605 RepID=A0AAV1CS88_OLDCO|nr:OLC1v1034820C1 [Oldenlandia corymbosa var. corymbosa]